jgi:hypothetical protein
LSESGSFGSWNIYIDILRDYNTPNHPHTVHPRIITNTNVKFTTDELARTATRNMLARQFGPSKRYGEHFHDYKYNIRKSNFAAHLLDRKQSISPIREIMEILHTAKKGRFMDTIENIQYIQTNATT